MRAPVDCLCLTAPTACGKSQLALTLAERFPLEIVSMDSAMVYRGLDVGTAKPAPAVRARVAHHLIDIADPSETYSAGDFHRDAVTAIESIRARNRFPLVVGGTLLYLRALREGLAELPSANAAVRQQLDAEGERLGWPELHRELERVDPASAARIAPSDRQRIQRALEVYRVSGIALSDLHRRGRIVAPLNVQTLALVPEDRSRLAERIEVRFDAMVDAGLVDEVAALKSRGDLTAATPSMRAVGYRQVWSYLAGHTTWAEARQRALAATRQLAKRQLTWLRGEARIERVPADRGDVLAALAAAVERAAGWRG
jgi:tRNA dimethylallyltransferase